MRSFTEMVCDGPSDDEGYLSTLTLPEPSLIASVTIRQDTSAQTGKPYGNIEAVTFRKHPTDEDLQFTGTMKNPLAWRPERSHPFTMDFNNGRIFIEYLSQFDSKIEDTLREKLASNSHYLDRQENSVSPRR